MQFTSKEDIEAPIERVFAEITDFQGFERSALRRGADIKRTDTLRAPGVGVSWHAVFKLRGKQRTLDVNVAEYDPPNGITLGLVSASIEGQMIADLVALSRGRTRMSVTLVLQPRSLAARLMMQSLKLARSNLTKRFKVRVAEYAMEVEERYQQSA
ncbi:SRPBCC family protein [Roseovarius sp.]|uniref:SRPBCC family protein n=1 Tax=Roseovarius sp. TaxID=1486281 RepID=UPI003A979078